MLVASRREIDVAKWKLEIIQAELRSCARIRPDLQCSLEDRANALASQLKDNDIDVIARAVQIVQTRDSGRGTSLTDIAGASPGLEGDQDHPPAYSEALEHSQ